MITNVLPPFYGSQCSMRLQCNFVRHFSSKCYIITQKLQSLFFDSTLYFLNDGIIDMHHVVYRHYKKNTMLLLGCDCKTFFFKWLIIIYKV